MKHARVLSIALLVLWVSACAPSVSPRVVGWEYWTLRTQLDPACADRIVKASKPEALQEIEAYRKEMKTTHPGLDSYKFDFSKVQATLVTQSKETARVRIMGQALVYLPDGSLLDDDKVDDTIDLKLESGRWKIIYN